MSSESENVESTGQEPTSTSNVPIVKGTIQTTLELTFPELYKSILLPSDVQQAKQDAEHAADAELARLVAEQEVLCTT
jgi:hypothetical protein